MLRPKIHGKTMDIFGNIASSTQLDFSTHYDRRMLFPKLLELYFFGKTSVFLLYTFTDISKSTYTPRELYRCLCTLQISTCFIRREFCEFDSTCFQLFLFRCREFKTCSSLYIHP